MKARFASGLFRLWVVLTMLWLAAAGVNIVVLYQTVPQHALIKGRIAFDDLIPAYEHCWKSSDGKEVNIDDFISDKDFAQIAECETAVDRWEIIRNDVLIALGIPFAILVVGWGLVWAFRGLLPANNT